MLNRDCTSIIRLKPKAMKTQILGLYEALGFKQQEQTKPGWIYLGNGAYKRSTGE